MSKTPEPPAELTAHLTDAANALRLICRARERADHAFTKFAAQWEYQSADALARRARSNSATLAERTRAHFLAAQRLADVALETLDYKPLRSALQEVFSGAAMITRFRHLTAAQRMAAAFVAVEVSLRVRCPPGLRNKAGDYLKEQQESGVQPDFDRVLADTTATRVKDLIHTVARGLRETKLPPQTWEEQQDPRPAADLLADAANRQASEASALVEQFPEYDLSENNLRLRSIELNGFRGSPKRVKVKFEQSKAPTSAIIFGENGVGKSTIADAIEFALQGRIGRSSNFESPVGSSARSFAEDSTPAVTAVLSDGKQVKRQVTEGPAGYLVAEPKSVSAGFRLAPITVKRNDILQFLDTESMERGSLLLDYFPSEAGELASRPQDEIHRLTSEQAELRIHRTSAMSSLADLLGCSPFELADRQRLVKSVRDSVMGGKNWKDFEDPVWDDVDPDVKTAAQRLAGIYNRLTVAKKRIEEAGNVLNPAAHKRQTQFLRPILAGIGSELSQGFNQITQGYPVERIDVVFGESGPLSLDVVVRLTNGRNCFPQQLFSEAYKDLIALLFFTSVAKKAAERGQAKILILDDVLQSVDAGMRHAFMTYVLKTFSDWQLVVTAHDRLWRDQLRELFVEYDHAVLSLEIRDWEFDTGPVLDPPTVDRITKDLKLMMNEGEPRSIAALAGQLLELTCDRLTLSMRLEVPRKETYYLNDLWPVVRTRLIATAAGPTVQRVGGHRFLRNLTVHPDPRSWDLTRADARAFAKAVLDLVNHVRCRSCGWLKADTCKCGAVHL